MILGMFLALTGPAAESATGIIVRAPAEIEFTATVHASRFDGQGTPGYHAIVWRQGHSARFALLTAAVSDVEVLDALEKLGAHPGPSIPLEAWAKRRQPDNAASGSLAEGPRVSIFLRLPGSADLVPLAAVLEDKGGRGLDLRLSGNRENAAKWMSGCLVCLFSCPGAKIGNARYSVRDYDDGITRFRVRRNALPPDGTHVGVVMRIESPGPSRRK